MSSHSVPRRRARILFSVLGGALLLMAAAALPASAIENPVYYLGNPNCSDIGLGYGFKVDLSGGPDGTYYFVNGGGGVLTGGALPDPYNSVTISNSDGYTFDWSSTIGIDAVIVKGGPNANVWFYSPEATSDTGLHPPHNSSTPNPNDYYEISHIEFCYDYEVEVSKTADTSFTRTWSWTIEKSASDTEITLAYGQKYKVSYKVVVSATYADSDWAVEGDITIHNPAPFPATVESVADVITPGDIVPTIDCGVTFPHEIVAFGDLVCSYSSDLPDGSTRTNTATVTTSGPVGGGEGTATVDFAGATITEIDESVDVSDTLAGFLGTVAAPGGDPSGVFEYSYWIDSTVLGCGRSEVKNVASFVTNDTGATDDDDWTILVDVTCDNACTLTQGYWKTHSLRGPAPYDDNWANLANGADTPFFDTGMSYYEVLWTAPKGGNPYYILAHQYIAAELNVLNGSSAPPGVASALADAAALLDAYDTPMPKIPKHSDDGEEAVTLAGILASFNEGYIGPGHCSE